MYNAAHGGQTDAKLAQDRTECLSFVQAHPETSTQLAEAACLLARGYRAPVEMSLGPSRIGQVFTDARGDATSMVRDFQACRVEAANAPMPEVSDTVKTGIVAGFFATRQTFRQMRRISVTVGAVERGDLSARIAVAGDPRTVQLGMRVSF